MDGRCEVIQGRQTDGIPIIWPGGLHVNKDKFKTLSDPVPVAWNLIRNLRRCKEQSCQTRYTCLITAIEVLNYLGKTRHWEFTSNNNM